MISYQARWLIQAEFISNIGWAISQLALPMLAVLELKASVTQVGTMMLISGLCPVAARPLSRVVARNFMTTRILVLGNFLRGVIQFAPLIIGALDFLSMRVLYVLAATMGISGSLIRPSLRVQLASTCQTKNEFIRATKHLSQAYLISGVAGASLSGALISAIGSTPSLAIDGVTYAVAAIIIATTNCAAEPPTNAEQQGTATATAMLLVVRQALYVESIAALGLGLSSAIWTIHVTTTLEIPPWQQGLASAFGTTLAFCGTLIKARPIDSKNYWRLSGLTNLAGALTQSILALAAIGPLAAGALLVHQIITNPLSAVRDISLSSGRIHASPQAQHPHIESLFYAIPLAMSSVGRAITIFIDIPSTSVLMLIATIPALISGLYSLSCSTSYSHQPLGGRHRGTPYVPRHRYQ